MHPYIQEFICSSSNSTCIHACMDGCTTYLYLRASDREGSGGESIKCNILSIFSWRDSLCGCKSVDLQLGYFIHLILCPLIYPSTHPCIYTLIHPCIHASMHSCTHAFMHACTSPAALHSPSGTRPPDPPVPTTAPTSHSGDVINHFNNNNNNNNNYYYYYKIIFLKII